MIDVKIKEKKKKPDKVRLLMMENRFLIPILVLSSLICVWLYIDIGIQVNEKGHKSGEHEPIRYKTPLYQPQAYHHSSERNSRSGTLVWVS